MRTNARDQILLVQLSVSAVVLAAAFAKEGFSESALIVPYLSLILVPMQCHHDWVCRLLSDYLRCAEGPRGDWWNEDKVGDTVKAGWFYTVGAVFGVVLTGVIALSFTSGKLGDDKFLDKLWIFGWVALSVSVILLIGSRLYRFGFRKKAKP